MRVRKDKIDNNDYNNLSLKELFEKYPDAFEFKESAGKKVLLDMKQRLVQIIEKSK